jgi:hypothetical protein
MRNFVKGLVIMCCLGSAADAARVKGLKVPRCAPQLTLERVRSESPVVPPSPKCTRRLVAERTPPRTTEEAVRACCASKGLEPKSLYSLGSKHDLQTNVPGYYFWCDARDGGLERSAELISLFQSQEALALITHFVIQSCSPEFANDRFVASLFTGLLPLLRDVTFVDSLMPDGREPRWVKNLRARGCKVNFVIESSQEDLRAELD